MYNCKVRVIKYAEGVFPEYQPEIGKVYDAKYWKQTSDNRKKARPVCIIDVRTSALHCGRTSMRSWKCTERRERIEKGLFQLRPGAVFYSLL